MTNKLQNWEERFDEEFITIVSDKYGEWELKRGTTLKGLKSFIRQELEAQKQEIKEMIEGMEKVRCDCKDPNRTEHKDWCGCKTEDYNQALSDIIKNL